MTGLPAGTPTSAAGTGQRSIGRRGPWTGSRMEREPGEEYRYTLLVVKMAPYAELGRGGVQEPLGLRGRGWRAAGRRRGGRRGKRRWSL